MKNNIKGRLIGLLIVGSVSLNFNMKVFISIVNPVSDAAAESVQGKEAKLASSLPRSSTTRSEETPKAATPTPSHPQVGDTTGVPVSYEDLIGITDVGDFAISPDGSAAAVEIRRADLKANSVKIRWIVVSLGDNAVRDVGDGGQPILSSYRGLGVSYAGVTQMPQWTPDSQWIIYRAMHGDEIQLWRSRRDGSAQERLTSNPADVDRYQVARDGRKVFFSTEKTRTEIQEERDTEKAKGALYDGRFVPAHSLVPLRNERHSLKQFRVMWTVDLKTRAERIATSEEEKEFDEFVNRIAGLRPSTRLFQRARRVSDAAWLEDLRTPPQPRAYAAVTVVASRRDDQREVIICSAPECTGRIRGLAISDDGHRVVFWRPDGRYTYGPMSMYEWKPTSRKVRKVLSTPDLLDACRPVGKSLVCAHESGTTPRKLVNVNLHDGTITSVYDPNNDLSHRRFGEVTELFWNDADGAEGFGHLIKPLGYRAGRRYPLVIVQYRSRGFLRGGVGDVYPIHIFAAKGFAVLSFDEPNDWKLIENSSTEEEVDKRGWEGLRTKRLVFSVLMAGIDHLSRAGIIDPRRIGITGMSSGGENASFAIIHAPDRFAAAAVNWTAWNPIAYYLFGPDRQSLIRNHGFGNPLLSENNDHWHEMSIALNASKIQTPLLIQVSDSELLAETQTFTELQEHGKPIEMHVFADEYHAISQPVHRYSIYKRSVQWMQFWLEGQEDQDPVSAGQYQRWRRLREMREAPTEAAKGLSGRELQ